MLNVFIYVYMCQAQFSIEEGQTIHGTKGQTIHETKGQTMIYKTYRLSNTNPTKNCE
jgi:hypothetical protein